jgi:starch synthase
MHDTGTGFVFYDYNPEAFWDCILRATRVFCDSAEWKKLVQRGMKADFSWARSVVRYEEIYRDLLGGPA